MSDEKLSYLGNPHVKRDGVRENWTPELLDEYTKCMNSPEYFAEKYVKVISLDKGLVPFKLYDYQKKMFKHFNDNRFNITLACRQSGKSISVCAYLLWYAIFTPEKNVVVLANKAATAREMIGRITLMLENIPFFLQPGCKALNKASIEFSNNSKIIAGATSSSSIRGLSVNLLYLDEFAFVDNASVFYTSTYPVVTAGTQSKVIITSTANGLGNMFHTIWEGAVQRTNEYKPFRVDWWDVPGRDEEWKRQTISNTSPLQFEQEFGNNFIGTGNTLVDSEALLKLRANKPIFVQNNARVYEKPKTNHNYVMTVDVGRGIQKDYSTFTIVDISVQPFRVVVSYQNNEISPLLFPDVIYKYATTYNEAYVLVESNDHGIVVCNALYYDMEYENLFVESAVKANGIGVNMTKKIKRVGCSNIKDLIEGGQIEINDAATIMEVTSFEAKGNSYEASPGNHDDLVMNLVLFGWFVSTNIFGTLSEVNLKELLYEERVREIEEDLMPAGFFDVGSDETLDYEDKFEIDAAGRAWEVSSKPGYL